MIDFDNIISDELLAAYIDGNTNSFESFKIDSSLATSPNLTEVADILNDIQSIDVESLPIEDVSIDLSSLNELNHKLM